MDHNRNQTAYGIIAYLSSSLKTVQQISVYLGKLSYRKETIMLLMNMYALKHVETLTIQY